MSGSRIQVRIGLLADGALPPDPGGGLALITDSNVEALLPSGWQDIPRHVLPAGEQSKSWSELERCLLALDSLGLDRDGLLLAVGGGVVTDLGGMAASLHRRGLSWVAVPTSLIGQVDAAIGGKTAVNLGGGKNTVGSVHLPERVLIDPSALATLATRHLRSGMAEVLKTALIAGAEATVRALSLEPEDFARARPAAVEMIEACVATKQSLVEIDLHDRGLRRQLNLGHTFGHALEALSLGSISHGEAVGLGLLCAARFSAAADLEQTLRETLSRWGLPTTAQASLAALASELARDKKRLAGRLTVVTLEAPGRIALRQGLEPLEIMAAFEAVIASP